MSVAIGGGPWALHPGEISKVLEFGALYRGSVFRYPLPRLGQAKVMKNKGSGQWPWSWRPCDRSWAARTQTEILNVFGKRTNKRHMSKHITNDFHHQFSTCFNVRAVGGSTMKQPHSEVHSCPPGLSFHSTPPQREIRPPAPQFTGGLCGVELLGLCAWLGSPVPFLFSFSLPVPVESVWMAGGPGIAI